MSDPEFPLKHNARFNSVNTITVDTLGFIFSVFSSVVAPFGSLRQYIIKSLIGLGVSASIYCKLLLPLLQFLGLSYAVSDTALL